jgi:hypothetical protein
MGDVMQEIINEIKEGGIQLIDHATSLLHVIASVFEIFAFPR